MRHVLKSFLWLVIFVSSQDAIAQKFSVHRKKQLFFGVNTGFNYSGVRVKETHHVLVSTPQSGNALEEKNYDKLFKNRASQLGFQFTYGLDKSFSILGQVGIYNYGFNYFTDFSWADTVSNTSVQREMHHLQRISTISIPLLVRWEMSTNQFSPFFQAGIYSDFRRRAYKQINYDNTIDQAETEGQISSTAEANMTDHTKKFNFGIVGGMGVYYYTKRVIIGVESNFRIGFLNTIEDRNRYIDQTGFTTTYLDVFDQFKLNNLNFQFSVHVPINHMISLNVLRRKRY